MAAASGPHDTAEQSEVHARSPPQAQGTPSRYIGSVVPSYHATRAPHRGPSHPEVAMTDDELCASFDSATLAKESFHHREHLRVAFLYLSRHPADAVPRFCEPL